MTQMVRCDVDQRVKSIAFQPILTPMATADADIDSTEDPSSSTDSEFEEYATPPAGRNEIQPYRFKPTVKEPRTALLRMSHVLKT